MIYARHILAGDIGVSAELCAGGYVHRVILLDQLIEHHILTHSGVQMDFHAGVFDALDIPVQDLPRQTVFGDAESQYAARDLFGFEDIDLITAQSKIIGALKPLGPAPITAICFPFFASGVSLTKPPFSNVLSETKRLMSRIATDASYSPRLHLL